MLILRADWAMTSLSFDEECRVFKDGAIVLPGARLWPVRPDFVFHRAKVAPAQYSLSGLNFFGSKGHKTFFVAFPNPVQTANEGIWGGFLVEGHNVALARPNV